MKVDGIGPAFCAVFLISVFCFIATTGQADQNKDEVYSKSISVFNKENGFHILRHILANWESIEEAMKAYEYVDECVKKDLSLESLRSVYKYTGDIRESVAEEYDSIERNDHLYSITMYEPCIVKDQSTKSSWTLVESNGVFNVLEHEIMME